METSYLAGLFDGEGLIRVNRLSGNSHSLIISLKNSHFGVLKQIHSQFGGSIYLDNKKVSRHKICGNWALHGKEAFRFLELIRPFSIIKAAEIDSALTFPFTKVLTREIIKKREEIHDELRNLKQKRHDPIHIIKNNKIATSAKIDEAVKLYRSGLTTEELAPMFNVNPETVQLWMRRRKENRNPNLSHYMSEFRYLIQCMKAVDRIRAKEFIKGQMEMF